MQSKDSEISVRQISGRLSESLAATSEAVIAGVSRGRWPQNSATRKRQSARGHEIKRIVITAQLLMNHLLVSAKKIIVPMRCVDIMRHKAPDTGRFRRTHFSFCSTTSLVSKNCSTIQAASTQTFKPPNMMATLIRTALGRKLPIFIN